MPRKLSAIAPDWWDYTTLDAEIIERAARLTPTDMPKLSRAGSASCSTTRSRIFIWRALEYITAWQQSTPDNPVGICDPVGRLNNCRLWRDW